MGKRREKKRKRFQQELDKASDTVIPDSGNTPFPFSIAELGSCIKVLNAINEANLIQHSKLRELRKALDPLVQNQIQNYTKQDKLDVNQPPRKKQKTSDLDQINTTKLRAERMKHLEKLNEEGKQEVLRVLDGVGHDHTPNSNFLLTNGSDQLQLPAGEDVTITDANDHEEEEEEKIISNAIKCYICKKKFNKLHFYYDQLCPECAELNYRKRTETVDMKGKVCFVTGARVKIGYRCALKLLRCGAIVIATTRFPADAARRFEAEKDFTSWNQNLHIFGLDFRNIAALESFCEFLKQKFTRLDVIINNACQTIRRPPAYYQHLLKNEKENSNPENMSKSTLLLLKQNFELNNNKNNMIKSNESFTVEEVNENDEKINNLEQVNLKKQNSKNSSISTNFDHHGSTSISSAEMSQIELIPEDKNYSSSLFPTTVTDVNEQQVDLRTKNSWMLKLDELSTPELAEVMVINAMAPTIINSRLKPLMEFDVETPKFIVNVSAMEGKFYRYKSDTHPHTNMAKAALNMMTRTSAQDYKKKNIFMTSVDTGWINDEKPLQIAVAHMQKHNFQTPLDEIDAAARVLDPVIAPLLDLAQGRKFDPPWGIFLKDYAKCEW